MRVWIQRRKGSGDRGGKQCRAAAQQPCGQQVCASNSTCCSRAADCRSCPMERPTGHPTMQAKVQQPQLGCVGSSAPTCTATAHFLAVLSFQVRSLANSLASHWAGGAGGRESKCSGWATVCGHRLCLASKASGCSQLAQERSQQGKRRHPPPSPRARSPSASCRAWARGRAAPAEESRGAALRACAGGTQPGLWHLFAQTTAWTRVAAPH